MLCHTRKLLGVIMVDKLLSLIDYHLLATSNQSHYVDYAATECTRRKFQCVCRVSNYVASLYIHHT